MSELFGSAASQKPGSQAANGAAGRKTAKNGSKKCKNRSARYPKASNNSPYLPPEVSDIKLNTSVCFKALTYFSSAAFIIFPLSISFKQGFIFCIYGFVASLIIYLIFCLQIYSVVSITR